MRQFCGCVWRLGGQLGIDTQGFSFKTARYGSGQKNEGFGPWEKGACEGFGMGYMKHPTP